MSVAVTRPTALGVGDEAIRLPAAPRTRVPTGMAREPLTLAAVLFGLTWVVFAVLAAAGTTAFRSTDAGRLPEVINATTAVLAMVVSGLCLMRWRLIGDTGVLWVGAALLVYGGVKVGVGELLLPLNSTNGISARAADAIGASALVTAVIFLLFALREAPGRWRRTDVLVIGAA